MGRTKVEKTAPRKTTTRKTAVAKLGAATPQKEEFVPKMQPIGTLGTHFVMKLTRVTFDGRPYIEVLTATGLSFKLSDRDMAVQYKPYEKK